jgi:hypothetical protein
MDFKNEVMNIQVRVIVARVYYMTKYSTVRPRNTQPQATMTSQVHFFKLGPKKKDEKIYVVKTLSSLFVVVFLPSPDYVTKSYANFELHGVFLSPKHVHLKVLLYFDSGIFTQLGMKSQQLHKQSSGISRE